MLLGGTLQGWKTSSNRRFSFIDIHPTQAEASRNHQSSSSSSTSAFPLSRVFAHHFCINFAFHPHYSVVAALFSAIMAMATGATMASYTAVRSPSQLHNKATLSSRNSVAFSGFNATSLKVNNTVGRIAFSRSSVKAAMEVDISKIVPQADRVLIRLQTLASQSAGGVLLPSAAVKYDRYLQGEIIAAGSEVTEVEKGQKVMFADVNAYEVNLGTSDRLCFCRSGDLLAIVQ